MNLARKEIQEQEQHCCDQFEPVIDSHSGDEICMSCGRARVYLLHDYLTPPPSSFFRREEEEEEGENSKSVQHLIIELMDIASNQNVPETIAETATSLLKKERRERGKTTADRSLAAYCLYRAFHMHEVPRSFKEISHIYNLPAKTIGRYETTNNTLETLKPSQLAERALSRLHIFDMRKLNHVKTMADKLYEEDLSSVSPQSALATSVALSFPHLPLASIAEQCHISRQTLLKHYNRIRAVQPAAAAAAAASI